MTADFTPMSRFFRPVMFITLLAGATKLLQVAAGLMIAYKWGAARETDAYYLAKSIPIGIYLIADNLLYHAFVPVYRRQADTGDTAHGFLGGVALISLLTAIGLALILLLLAQPLARLLAPGFSPEQVLFTTQLIRIIGISIFFSIPASFLKAFNACHDRYIIVALDGFVISGVLVVVILACPLSWGIAPLAAALPAAFILLAAIQLLAAVPRLRLSTPALQHPLLREITILMIPLASLTALQQLNLLFMNAVVSYTDTGNISCLNYSYTIAQIPVGIIDLVLFSAVFPLATALASQDKLHSLRQVFGTGSRLILAALLPICIWIVLERHHIIALMLKHGRFDATAGDITAAALLGHALAIPWWTMEALGCRCLFARQKHWRYFRIVGIRLLVNIALCLLLIKTLGILGVTLAFALSFVIGALLAARAIWRDTPRSLSFFRPKNLLFGLYLMLAGTATGLVITIFNTIFPDLGALKLLFMESPAILGIILIVMTLAIKGYRHDEQQGHTAK